MSQPRSKKVDVHGWIVLDKDFDQTSTHAVSQVRRLFNAKKGGHAGTLDPRATGERPSTPFTSCNRSWRRSWREETFTAVNSGGSSGISACQLASWRAARSMTNRPSSTISPVSSAIAMKSPVGHVVKESDGHKWHQSAPILSTEPT